MTPKNRNAVTKVLRNTLINKQPTPIGPEPQNYDKNNKIVSKFLKQWTEPTRYVGFMESSKPGIRIVMLMGAGRGNIIVYTISNDTRRYIQIDLETLTTTVNKGWSMQKNLKLKGKILLPGTTKKQ